MFSLKGKMRSIDHDGSEAVVDAALAGFKGIAGPGAGRWAGRYREWRFHQLAQVNGVSIVARTLETCRIRERFLPWPLPVDSLDDLHVVYVKALTAYPAGIRFLEHFGYCY